MCRFALYCGSPILVSSLVTEPANSIIHQSFHSHEREEPLNGDGFGLAWYVPDIAQHPAVFKDVMPAWSNENLLSLARVTSSRCMLAHVRAATPGSPVSRLNCHPFAWRQFCFMHNGDIGGFSRIVRRLRDELSEESYHRVRGSTDSEHIFALFADHYEQAGETDALERMARSLLGAIAQVEALKKDAGVTEPAYLNLAVADGARAVCCRYVTCGGSRPHTLYTHVGGEYVCDDGVARIVADQGNEAVIVASEPLSSDPGWQAVPENHMVLVRENLQVQLRPIDV